MTKAIRTTTWFEPFLHLRYKIDNPTEALARLGFLTMDDIRVNLLRNTYNKHDVFAAVKMLTSEGYLDLWYYDPTNKQPPLKEVNPQGNEVGRKIELGEIFDKKTGEPYSLDKYEVRWTIPEKYLLLLPEDNQPVVTLFDRLKRFFRWPQKQSAS